MQQDVAQLDVRVLLDEPLFANLPFTTSTALSARPRRSDDSSLTWSHRATAHHQWLSDADQHGPVQRTLETLLRVWRGPGEPGAWAVEQGAIEGVLICRDFLDADEIVALRLLFHAHHGWAMYNWGNARAHRSQNQNMSPRARSAAHPCPRRVLSRRASRLLVRRTHRRPHQTARCPRARRSASAPSSTPC